MAALLVKAVIQKIVERLATAGLSTISYFQTYLLFPLKGRCGHCFILHRLCTQGHSRSRSIVRRRWDTPQHRSSCGGSVRVLRRSHGSAHPAREIPPHRTGSFCNKLRGYRRPARYSRPLSTFSDHKVHKLRRHPQSANSNRDTVPCANLRWQRK